MDAGPQLASASVMFLLNPGLYGAAHILGGSSLLHQTSLETSSSKLPEVCVLDDSKHSQVDSGHG